MKILFDAPENAWGGFPGLIRNQLPAHRFEATGRFAVKDTLGLDWAGGKSKAACLSRYPGPVPPCGAIRMVVDSTTDRRSS